MAVATCLQQLQSEICARYSELSKRLQEVACYVLDNTSSVAFDSVAVIAKKAGVPPSTLIRFANAFEYNGFNEMKQIFRLNLLEETNNYTDRIQLFRKLKGDQPRKESPENILYEFTRSNAQAMEQLATRICPDDFRQAIDLLDTAENIFVVGLRRSFGIAIYLTYALSHLERRVFLVDSMGGMFREQLDMIGPDDVVVAISYTPYAEETVITSTIAAEKGAKQIIITDSTISPLAKFSDVCFVVKEAQVDAFRSLSATQCLVQSLIVALVFKNSTVKDS